MDEQPSNALWPMLVNFSWSSTLFKALQPWKVKLAIALTPAGMLTRTSFGQEAKAKDPMVVTLWGMEKMPREEHPRKAELPMDTTPSEILMEVRRVHP